MDAPARLDGLIADQEWMSRLAQRLCGDPDEAADLVQDTWLAALRGGGDGRPSRGWLAAVLRRRSASRWRARDRGQARERESVREHGAPASDELAAKLEAQQIVGRAVLALEEPYRTVVLLRYQEGQDAEAIGRALGRSAGTVRSQLQRALARLREELDRESGGDRDAWLAALAPLAAFRLREPVPVPAPGASTLVPLASAAAVTGLALVLGTRLLGPAPFGEGIGLEERTDTSASEVQPPDERRRAVVVPPLVRESDDVRRILLVEQGTERPLDGEPVRVFDGAGAWVAGETDGDGALEVSGLDPGTSWAIEPTAIHDPRTRIPSRWRELAAVERGASLEDPSAADPDSPPVVAVPCGASYALELRGAIETGSYHAELHPLFAFDAGEPEVVFGRVRSVGASHAVRFGAEARLLPQTMPWGVRVASADGLSASSTEPIARNHPDGEPVRVWLRPTAVVEGRVVDLAGRPVAGATVTLLSWAGDRGPEVAVTDRDGAYSFKWVESGSYAVLADAPGRESARVDVEALGGRSTVHELVAASRGEPVAVGVVRGELRSESGAWCGRTRVVLTSETPGVATRTASVEWVESNDHERIGSFELDGLAEGEYRAILQTPDSCVRIDGPTRVLALAGAGAGEPARWSVRDSEPSLGVSFLVRDAADHEAIGYFDIVGVVRRADGVEHPVSEFGTSGSASLHDVPLGAEFDLWIVGPGIVPQRVHEPVTRFCRSMRVPVERGWGARLVARDEAGAPVEGVRISLDGVDVGSTGADGSLFVQAGAPPRQIEVAGGGWTVAPPSAAFLRAVPVAPRPDISITLAPVR